jgi:hypothetical protein
MGISHGEGRQGQSWLSKALPSEEMKWRYACRLFGMNSLKDGAMWHEDLLLGNENEISNCITAAAK